jgi:nucleotide-binding universal stress UspA family protein
MPESRQSGIRGPRAQGAADKRAASPSPESSMAIAIRRILVPIDFSEHSLYALDYADIFAREFHAELVLVHVVERTPYEIYAAQGVLPDVPMYPLINNQLVDPEFVKAETKKQLDKLAGERRGGPCTTEVRDGHPVDQVLKAAQDQRCDLIVICTHGRTGLSHLVMGSVAEKIVRLSPIPVLSIRAKHLKG